ncbi:retinol dehydrogenase 12-like [Oratosquilla oratoria]|uniref:retinol dehydrogenase 12-like n=1 Tax=Oratosquilla oratoria TaxID=337810 RepID=UPI003F75A2F3
MWMIAAAVIVGAGVMFKIFYYFKTGMCKSEMKLVGKTVIVTGASAGIGKETARDFALRGARVILACRNLEKAQRVADDIINTTGNGFVVVRKLDTSDLASVRAFAEEYKKTEKDLHILVNNAGIGGSPTKQVTGDGLERTMATNHYGHFLLTNLLSGMLKSSAPSRIVNLSSLMHQFCKKLDPEDLNFEKERYSPSGAYAKSKLCNILFTVELAEKLKGTGVVASAVHPGAVSTEIFGKEGSLVGRMAGVLVYFMGKSEKEGAQTTIFAAVDESIEGHSGKYYKDCKETKCSDLASHRGFAKKLWEASELDVKLEPHETCL